MFDNGSDLKNNKKSQNGNIKSPKCSIKDLKLEAAIVDKIDALIAVPVLSSGSLDKDFRQILTKNYLSV